MIRSNNFSLFNSTSVTLVPAGGRMLDDNIIKDRFKGFYNLDEIEDVDDFIQLLNDNDDWFELMFKNTDL